MVDRVSGRHHVPRGQQCLAACDQQLCLLNVTVGQFVVDLLEGVQRLVVEVGGTLVCEACHGLIGGAATVFDGLDGVSRPRTFEVVVGQFSQ